MTTEAHAPNESTVIDGEIIEVKTPAAALAVMNPTQYGKELMEPYAKQLTAARRRVGREKFDVTTKDGMATAKQLKKLFVTIRTDADEAKSNAKRPIDAAGKAILAEFKPIEDGAKAEEKKIADVIAAEEARIEADKQAKLAAERARIEAIEARLAHIRNIPNTLALAESTKISTTIDALLEKQLDPALYDEFLEDAASAMIETVEALRGHLQAALAREEAARVADENARELARMKAEQAAREQAEREAQAERARQAQAERDAQAERERQIAEQQAAVQRQKQDMDDIMAINSLATNTATITTREQVEAALNQALHFDPAFYGALESMATMAKTMATTALQARLAQLPEPVPEPVAEESPIAPQPVAYNYVDNIETRTHEGHVLGHPINSTGQYYSRTTFKDNGEPILCNADGTRSVFCDLNDDMEPEAPAARPELAELVDVLAAHYQVEAATVVGWLLELNAEALALVA